MKSILSNLFRLSAFGMGGVKDRVFPQKLEAKAVAGSCLTFCTKLKVYLQKEQLAPSKFHAKKEKLFCIWADFFRMSLVVAIQIRLCDRKDNFCMTLNERTLFGIRFSSVSGMATNLENKSFPSDAVPGPKEEKNISPTSGFHRIGIFAILHIAKASAFAPIASAVTNYLWNKVQTRQH